jgi:4-amino-4-deoxy-L-arabinose transferase-like glycosyltransferase
MSENRTVLAGTETGLRGIHWLLLGISVAIFLALRVRWLGHLLVWDEAMTLCTVRSLVSGGQDYFSLWFWRHPPLFTALMALLHPLSSGFDLRTELMAIGFGLINLFLLFRLNRRVFGSTVALWSVFFLAVMPGAVFFDTWVKTDHPVTTFGLLALLCALENRVLFSGLCLGLAFLSKENAIFYAMATVLLYFLLAPGRRRVGGVLALALVPVVCCSWWYLMFSGDRPISSGASAGGFFEYLRYGLRTDTGFAAPWYYYLQHTVTDLGAIGLILAAGGIILIAATLTSRLRERGTSLTSTPMLWPLLLLLPAYILISVMSSKVAWIIMVLLPAWATLQGVAMSACIDVFRQRSPVVATAVGMVIVVISFMPVTFCRYDAMLRTVDASQWRGATYSRQAALRMNRLVKDGDRILLTSFHYWKGLGPGEPCAVFTYYFTRKTEVLIRPHQATFDQLLGDIRKYRLDWALLSPEPGVEERELFGGFMGKLGLTPCRLPQARIFKTSALYEQPAQ